MKPPQTCIWLRELKALTGRLSVSRSGSGQGFGPPKTDETVVVFHKVHFVPLCYGPGRSAQFAVVDSVLLGCA